MAKDSTAKAREGTRAAERRAQAQADEEAAIALFNRAVALKSQGQAGAAIAAYERLVSRFGSTNELLIANALFNKGFILQFSLQQPAGAIEAYDALLARFDAAKEPQLMEPVAKARQNKGALLYGLGRRAEAIKVYDELEERIGSATDPVLGGIVTSVRFNRKILSYEEIVEHFHKISNPTLDERVIAATALVDKGNSFSDFPNGKETAIENYDQVVERFGNADELPLRERVIRALFNKSVALRELDRTEDAIASVDEIVARFGKSEEPALRERVIRALGIKGNCLEKARQLEEAIAVFNEILVRLERISELSLVDRQSHAFALRGKARISGLLGRRDEEIAAYDELTARFETDTEPDLRQQAAVGFNIKGLRLEGDDRLLEAITAYRKALTLTPSYDTATRNLERARARFDELQPEQKVTPQGSPEQENSQLVSEVPGYTQETPPPKTAVPPRLFWMWDAFAKIDELAALLPDKQREVFKAKVLAEFAAAAGVATVPPSGGLLRSETYPELGDADAPVRETTGQATAEPRPKSIADAKAEALAIGDTTLLGQLVRYEARLASIELPADGLKSPEQAQAAARLAKTYQDLRARQFERGLDPLPQDDRVTEAQRLASDFYRKHPKSKVKKATRSPPRRRNSTRTASPT
jgi:tetratricopeptide (TPR) repeat protein